MPELPEVEVVRRGLEQAVAGRTIAAVEVLHPRPVRRHPAGAEDFALTLIGRTMAVPRRRGKYLWLPLTDGDAILAHLGMSGQFLVTDASVPDARNTRIRFSFTDGGRQVRFVDQRMFGGLSVSIGGAELPIEIAHIGRDPFDPEFDLTATADRIRRKRTGIKRALLDQTVVSGIGNIYADEALWLARVHYAQAADAMARRRIVAALEAARTVMASALEQGAPASTSCMSTSTATVATSPGS